MGWATHRRGLTVVLVIGWGTTIGFGQSSEQVTKELEELRTIVRQQGEQIAELQKKQATTQPAVQTTQPAVQEKPPTLAQQIEMTAAKPTPAEQELVTIYDDGFVFKGADDILRIGGWAQVDFRGFESGHPGDTEFLIRRARLDVRGALEEDFGYRLYSDFSGSSAKLQEAWLDYHRIPELRLKVGQFKEPFSLEGTYSARWIDFIERSMVVTNLWPQEDIGAMAFGTLLDKRLEYGVGVFNGRGKNVDDTNDDEDLAARVVVAPWANTKEHGLKGLYLGGSVTTGHQEEDLAGDTFRTAPRTVFLTYAPGVVHDGNLTRFGADVEWLKGPLSVKAEWLQADFDDLELGAASEDAAFLGWYVSASYLLTGEQKPRNAPVRPRRNFGWTKGGTGAWEVMARYEQFDADQDLFSSGFASGTDNAEAVTLGLTWWPNVHTKVMLNYVHTWFDDDVVINGDSFDDEDALLLRFQFNF